MKRLRQRGTGLAMVLGLFAAMANAGEIVSSATGGWFAADARDVKDTTWEGGVIVGGETNLVLQCSPSAWGTAAGGGDVTVAARNATTGATGTIAERTTADAVGWTPNGPGTFVLTHTVATSGDPVALTATFAVAARVGDGAFASLDDGVCTIRGTGATYAYETAGSSPLSAYSSAITNLVVQDGVTGIGSRFFENMWHLQSVDLAASVTDVGARAFKRCYGLTNVVSRTTGAAAVGDFAFAGCHSLQGLTFAATPTFGTEAYSFQTAIYMKDGGIPEVYAMPAITIPNLYQHVMAKVSLTDATWTDVTKFTDEQKKDYHFFRIEMNTTSNTGIGNGGSTGTGEDFGGVD